MSRRHNGLPGADWHRLTDLEPPVADEVIESLAQHGIPAYAESPEPRGDVYFGTRPPTRAVDGVFVPLAALDRAREVLEAVLPEITDAIRRDAEAETDAARRAEDGSDDDRAGSDETAGEPAETPEAVRPEPEDEEGATEPRTDEEAWASIVAAWSAPPAEREWLDESRTAPGTGSGRPLPAPGDGLGTSAALSGITGFEDIREELDRNAPPDGDGLEQVEPGLDEHEHWVPPPAPPLPTADPVTRLAWTGFVGGPLFLILAALLEWEAGGLTGLLAVLASVGGFVTLVARMRDEPRDPGDDGAVV